MKTKASATTNSISRPLLRCGLLFIPLVLGCFGLLSKAQAVVPPPDGGYPGNNTAEGDFALFNLATGVNNTAIGFGALLNNTTGFDNTAIGFQALVSNTTGFQNTADSDSALHNNVSGFENTANGFAALFTNTSGDCNTANGFEALFWNTGSSNTAIGSGALFSNTAGSANTATGLAALAANTTGDDNTANGVDALFLNTTGHHNTADGSHALFNNTGQNNTATGAFALFSTTTGSGNTANGLNALRNNTTGGHNIALGFKAGMNLTFGSNNIDIGAPGVAGEASTIRIGIQGTQTRTFVAGISGSPIAGSSVVVNANGRLGTVASSARFKERIKPMDQTSEAILALKPVTFRYKKELDPEKIPQFGLIAEEVEKVNPDLVVRDEEGRPYSVRYDQVNAMLLNEFLKEHRKVEKLEATVASLATTVKQQALQIQKVSAQLELNKPAPQTVVNNH